MIPEEPLGILLLRDKAQLKVVLCEAVDAIHQVQERRQAFPGVCGRGGSDEAAGRGGIATSLGAGPWLAVLPGARVSVLAVMVWLASCREDAD